MRHDDGHERELSYSRYVDTRLSLIAGYRFDTMDSGRDGPFAGVSFRLPYFIDLSLTHQSGGETRAMLMKSLQLTDHLSLELGYRYGRQTGVSTSADLRYLLTKQLSLTAGYSSDFGAGIGLITRF
jgi:outer membrane receptor protein involved in Fe transport